MASTPPDLNASYATGSANGRQQNPDEIRADIERTRADMDETVAAIQDKLDVNRLTDQAFDWIKDASQDAPRVIMNTIKHNVVPFTLIGAGIGWMLYNQFASGSSRRHSHRGSRAFAAPRSEVFGTPYGQTCGPETETGQTGAGESHASTLGQATEKVKGMASQAGEKISGMASSAGQRLRSATGRLTGRASSLGAQARQGSGHLAQRARAQAQRAGEGVGHFYHDYPLAAGAAALAAGLLAGMSIPISHRESRVLGPARDRMMDKAKAASRDMLQRGKDAAQNALHSAREQACADQGPIQSAADKADRMINRAAAAAEEKLP